MITICEIIGKRYQNSIDYYKNVIFIKLLFTGLFLFHNGIFPITFLFHCATFRGVLTRSSPFMYPLLLVS